MRTLSVALAAAAILSMTRAAGAQPANAAAPPYQGPGAVQVHIDPHGYEYPPSLAQAVDTPKGTAWLRLCKAPCDRPIDPSALYRIEGGHAYHEASSTDENGNVTRSYTVKDKFIASDSFHIFPSPASQTLRVDGGDRFWWSCKYWCTASAVGAGVVAGLAWGGAFSSDPLGRKIVRYSVGIPATAIFAMLGAFAVYSFTASTKVHDDSGRRLARRPIILMPNGLLF